MDTVKLALIHLWLRLSALLPLSMARGLGRFLARLYWPFGGRSRKVTELNIAAAFPDLTPPEQERLARQSIASTAELLAEMGHIWLKPWESVANLIVHVSGVELVTTALAEGRGVILLGPHLGNWEIAGIYSASLGRMISLYQPPKIKGLEAIVQKARQSSGGKMVSTDRRGLATLFRHLKGGGMSALLPDQAPADINSGQNSLFMGVSCFTGTLTSNMLQRTGAVAVFGYARRVPGGFSMHYEAAEEDIYDADIAVSLAALNRGVERCVRSCVEQYQWEYKRFRVRPRDGRGLYDDM